MVGAGILIFSFHSYRLVFNILNLVGMKVGIGLLVLQQLSGINGILFYAANIFKSAGKSKTTTIF